MNQDQIETKLNKTRSDMNDLTAMSVWFFWAAISAIFMTDPDEFLPLWVDIPLLLIGLTGLISRVLLRYKKSQLAFKIETVCYLLSSVFATGIFLVSLINGGEITIPAGVLALYSIIQTVKGFRQLRK